MLEPLVKKFSEFYSGAPLGYDIIQFKFHQYGKRAGGIGHGQCVF